MYIKIHIVAASTTCCSPTSSAAAAARERVWDGRVGEVFRKKGWPPKEGPGAAQGTGGPCSRISPVGLRKRAGWHPRTPGWLRERPSPIPGHGVGEVVCLPGRLRQRPGWLRERPTVTPGHGVDGIPFGGMAP